MPSPIINDVTPFIQYSATLGQTIFPYPFAIFEDADVRVYKRPADSSPSDATQLLELALDYTVTGAGSDDGGTIVLTTGAGAGDIITVIRALALERRTVFQPGTLTETSLNQEFNNILAMVQDLNMAVAKIIPAYNFAAIFNQNNKKLPTLPAGHIWRMSDAGDAIEAISIPDDDPGASILRADLASHVLLKGASLVGMVEQSGTVQDAIVALQSAPAVSGFKPGDFKESASGTLEDGFLWCDGSAVSRTTYAALFAAIGTVWGAGDGTTTFNVPDRRGRGSIGTGTGPGLTPRTLAQEGGEEKVGLAEENNGPHTHNVTINDNEVLYTTGGAGPDPIGSADKAYTTTSSGSGTPHENMPPFVAVSVMIKY